MSRLRSFLVVLACWLFWTLLGLFVGAVFHYPWLGLTAGVAFGSGYCLFGSWAAEKFPLEVWEARLLSQDQAPNAYEMLLELSEKTDTPQPTLYTCPRPEINAFALAGRDGSRTVVMSLGLTRHLERPEVQAVLALLMARLATGAMPSWTVTATLAGLPLYLGARLKERPATAWLGSAITAVFTPLTRLLLRLGCDPAVVLAADVHAVHLADDPDALPTALAKIEAAPLSPGGLGTNCLFAVPPCAVPPIGFLDVNTRMEQAAAAIPALDSGEIV